MPLLDLSTGINPLAYPVPALPPALWSRLPDPESLAELEAAAALAYGAPDASLVVAAPGTQAIIGLLPHLLERHLRPGGGVRVLSPTYAEHAASWAAAGRTVTAVASPDALADPVPGLPDAGVAVLCNPNNPDGRRLAPREVAALADRMAERGGILVVDESFADPDPLARTGSHPALLRLRSFGKFHGLAGLRLGFAILPPALAARLRQVLGPWPVSGPAAAIGTAALRDEPWARATRRRLDADAARLDCLLRDAGLRAAGAGGTPLFRLVHKPAGLWRRLGERGILVRRFDQGWLRFGLPGAEPDWARLEAGLLAPGASQAHVTGAPALPPRDSAPALLDVADPPLPAAPPAAVPLGAALPAAAPLATALPTVTPAGHLASPSGSAVPSAAPADPETAGASPAAPDPPPVFDDAFRTRLDTLFRWRRDVRRFRRDALAPGTLERLVAAACLAPSVGLCQPWRFAVVDDPARRARVRDIFRGSNARALACYDGERAQRYARLKLSGLEDAPVQFAVLADRATPDGHGLGRASMPEMAEYSVVTAVHTLWLSARAEGLGLGWVSILDPAEVVATLDLPRDWRLIGYFCLGHPEAHAERPELERLGWERRRDSAGVILHR